MDATKYLKADFLDILFEGKNKEYGAYELRRQYNRRITKSVIILTCLLLLFIGGMAISRLIRPEVVENKKTIKKILTLQQVDIDKPDLPPPPPPPPAPEPPKVKTQVKYTPPNVVIEELVRPEEESPDLTDIKDKAISNVNKQGDPNVLVFGLVKGSVDGVVASGVGGSGSGNQVFKFVEQMPSFPGGNDALMKYLGKHIRYPSVARENGIQGTVVVQFVVNTDGSIVQVKTVGKKKGGGLEQEAIRVIKGMPKWTPGKQNGRKVRVQFSLPIRFKLQ